MNKAKADNTVTIIGAGLAGCEAAYQLAKRGVKVRLYEMKPHYFTPAHSNPDFAELVCSNSLRSDSPENAVGLLKEELAALDSLIIKTARQHALPAGGALAVDRLGFSSAITAYIKSEPLIEVIAERVDSLPLDTPCIVASGPLTDHALYADILRVLGEDSLHFFDAAAPLVEADSLDYSIVFKQSRYDKGEAAYLNCPMSEEEYEVFWQELINAEKAEIKDFDKVFEGCMPIEAMAARGRDTMRFGMLKPVGLRDPRTGKRPYAVLQLRQDNATGSLFNLVGCQTRLKFPEQKRVFRLVPGLADAEFARYGVMHRNSYLKSPLLLKPDFSAKAHPHIFFAGQISGVEGYVESTASGLLAALNMQAYLQNATEKAVFPKTTIMGALQHYIAEADADNFQPMNANFGLVEPLTESCHKRDRKKVLLTRAREDFALRLAEISEL